MKLFPKYITYLNCLLVSFVFTKQICVITGQLRRFQNLTSCLTFQMQGINAMLNGWNDKLLCVIPSILDWNMDCVFSQGFVFFLSLSRQMDGWMNGRADGRTDRKTDRQTDTSQWLHYLITFQKWVLKYTQNLYFMW